METTPIIGLFVGIIIMYIGFLFLTIYTKNNSKEVIGLIGSTLIPLGIILAFVCFLIVLIC